MNVLVTGSAGFIGFHLCKKLVSLGYNVIGVDNLNKYYDISLKLDRLKTSGFFLENELDDKLHQSKSSSNYFFKKLDICDKEGLFKLAERFKINLICNLAAQAGVRYSIDFPRSYIDSNLVGFYNILELSRALNVNNLVFASSSSVYGIDNNVPFKTESPANSPISLYAATKKSNEVLAYSYSHLFNIPTTGLRFFTVYGPWGRPDMAYFKFANKIVNGKKIKIYNNGNMSRDFTYIDDVVIGITLALKNPSNFDESSVGPPFNIFNIGNGKPVNLLDFVSIIETELKIKAKKVFEPIQPGDVYETWADTNEFSNTFNFKPTTNINEGIFSFIDWYKSYYNIV